MMPPLPALPSLSQLSSLLPCRLHIEGRRTNYVTFQISISTISIITILLLTTTNIIIIIIIITRPKPAYGWQGLANISLRASGAQLGRGKCSFFVTHTQTLHHNIYIIIAIIITIIITWTGL